MRVTVLNQAGGWNRIPDLVPVLRKAVRAALKAGGRAGDVCVLLTDDAAVQQLNKTFRGKNKPTNVLSFPAQAQMEGHLGDIALAYGVCASEAKVQGKRVRDHASHLTVHGALHLIGYDHMKTNEAETMEALETAILARLGIKDPYRQRQ